MERKPQWAFIVWASHGRRSEMLADALGASLHFIVYKGLFRDYTLVRYIVQAALTLKVLFAERPRVVFVQTPPFVCSLVVYLYCKLTRSRFVLDHHTASFDKMWDWALPVQKFLARRAITNIVTGQYWVDVLSSWSADAFVLVDRVFTPERIKSFAVEPGFSIAYVNTFSADEPLDAVLEAASQLPDVRFYVTGKITQIRSERLIGLPDNVVFTGFLPDPEYFGLLKAVRVVMALTKRNYTLQCGGFEAMSLGQPLITSEWPYLQTLFPLGTVYVPNSAAGIQDGICMAQEKYETLKAEMMDLREETQREWEQKFSQLVMRCQAS